MSDEAPSPDADNELQFLTADPVAKKPASMAALSCVTCGQPITSTFFALADKPICPACRERLATRPSGSKVGRLLKAAFLGVAAGLIGAAIWFAIRRLAHLEIGLVAILVGFMVGAAVRKGSGSTGGRGYQMLAVVITYCCIAANYMPDVIEAVLASEDPAAQAAADGQAVQVPENLAAGNNEPQEEVVAAVKAVENEVAAPANPDPKVDIGIGKALLGLGLLIVLVFGFSLALPVMGGAENLIGLLIIGFALWEAWKINARRELPISGPYQVGTPRSSNRGTIRAALF